MRVLLSWAWAHPWSALSLGLLLAFVALNVLAYRHARALTCYAPGGAGPGKPESLSLGRKARVLLGGVQVPRPRADARPSDLGLAYAVHTFAGAAGALEAWHVPREGARGLAVLFHGYAGCKAKLLHEAKAFHELGYACLLVDFRGSGGSGGGATTVGYAEADDVARAVAYARRRWPGAKIILFGHSMGAVAALRALGVLGVEADAAVLECPFDTLRSAVGARFAALGVPAFPCADLLVFWGGWRHGFNGFRHDAAAYAQGVTCPVLLMHGRDDARVSAAQIDAVHAGLAGAKERHAFEGLGHESYAAARAEEWKDKVGRFLNKI